MTEPQNTHTSLGMHSLPEYVSFHLHQAKCVSSEEVQKELDAVLGPSQLICYEDRKNLPYTNAVIHEIQRYSCIAPVGVPRQCVKDTTLLGLPVPKVQRHSPCLYPPLPPKGSNVLGMQLIRVSRYITCLLLLAPSEVISTRAK